MSYRPDKVKRREYVSKDIIFKNGKLRVTQLFGERPEFYEKYGLKGHEGIDLGFTSDDWTLFSPVRGYVWKDFDVVRNGYGNHVAIVCPEERIVVFFCHMEKNFVSEDDQITIGDKIGIMGNTGNSAGAHLHLMIFQWEGNPANRLNADNGYKGMVDPIPYIQKWLEYSNVKDDIIFDKRYIDQEQIKKYKGKL